MIQDIYPHRLYNEYRPLAYANALSPVFSVKENSVLLRVDGSKVFIPSVSDLGLLEKDPNLSYLFALDDNEYFIYRGELMSVPAGFEYVNFRTIRHTMPPVDKSMTFIISTALHVGDWYSKTRFCGRCGSKMAHSHTERAMICEKCGNIVYPRIMPAVIVGVLNGNKMLVTKYANRPFTEYALVAGFTEIGETLEQTVEREDMEETGLKVKNIRYYKSQPWGVADDILSGFFCDVDGDDTITMDTGELKLAEWVTPETITLQSNDMSLTNEMMALFKGGL